MNLKERLAKLGLTPEIIQRHSATTIERIPKLVSKTKLKWLQAGLTSHGTPRKNKVSPVFASGYARNFLPAVSIATTPARSPVG